MMITTEDNSDAPLEDKFDKAELVRPGPELTLSVGAAISVPGKVRVAAALRCVTSSWLPADTVT